MVAKQRLLISVAVVAALVFAFTSTTARADWRPTDPAKYVQLPDAQSGMDVNATWLVDSTNVPPNPIFPYTKLLADDFSCFVAGPVTDLHIWGSWLGDQWNDTGTPSAAVNLNASFKLSIHADVPASDEIPYSHPVDAPLWSMVFQPDQYKMVQWGGPTSEVFYDPNTNGILGEDTRIWEYNFNIDPAVAFVQKGQDATAAPTIYWLDVQAIVPTVAGTAAQVFGWKTTLPDPAVNPLLNDDAVFTDTTLPGGSELVPPPNHTGPSPWVDMRYPDGSVYVGKSIDMAFAITPEPGTFVMLAFGGVLGLLIWIRHRTA